MVYEDAFGALRTDREVFHIDREPDGAAIYSTSYGEGEVVKVAEYESVVVANEVYDEAIRDAHDRNDVLSILVSRAREN